jgi:hypothetical protein
MARSDLGACRASGALWKRATRREEQMPDRVVKHLSDCRCHDCRARWTHGEWVIMVLAILIILGWIVEVTGR